MQEDHDNQILEYLNSIDKKNHLTKPQMDDLFLSFSEEKTVKKRNVLVEHNLMLVFSIVAKYKSLKSIWMDLIQVGNIALIKAVESFEPKLGYQFTTYGYRLITNEISEYVKKNAYLLKVSIDDVRSVFKIKSILKSQESLTNAQVAEKAGITLDELNILLPLTESILSLDYQSANDDIGLIEDVLSNENDVVYNIISQNQQNIINVSSQVLNEKQKQVLSLMFGLKTKTGQGADLNSVEAGEELGVSKQAVWKTAQKSLLLMRDDLGKRGFNQQDLI